MVLRSTDWSLADTIGRRPSISTRLRFEPRPRRLTFDWPPLPGLFDVLVPAGLTCGSVLRKVSRVMSAFSTVCSPVTTAIGLFDVRFGRAMRDPVTTMSSPGALVAGALSSTASAGSPTTGS